MYYSDYHTHSTCSPDGYFSVAEMAKAALASGLQELCITDHADLLDGEGRRCLTYDWAPLKEQLAQARAAVGSRLELRFGIELGEAAVSPRAAQEILAGAGELDFVLGSVHNLREEKGGTDFYYLSYHSPQACYEALDDYFAGVLELSLLPCWDSLAHLIYPLRYMVLREHQPVTLERYREQIRAILQNVISSDRALELNTYCGRTVDDWQAVLTEYRRMGGEKITIGSDAHRTKDVGGGVKEAAALLTQLGFRYYTVYRHHKPEMIKLG